MELVRVTMSSRPVVVRLVSGFGCGEATDGATCLGNDRPVGR